MSTNTETASSSCPVCATSITSSTSPLSRCSLYRVLMDDSAPVAKRTRAAFFLKQSTPIHDAIRHLAPGLRLSSVLLAHEIGYVIGQMGSSFACSFLVEALKDTKLHPVVRHECAEALAALGDMDSLNLLQELCNDEHPEISETCKIAVDRLLWLQQNKNELGSIDNKHFHSTDPAPAYPLKSTSESSSSSSSKPALSVPALGAKLCDSSLSLFERYRAMFTLRNVNTEESVLALCDGFSDTTSAVLRHEIAFVLGQMQHPAAVAGLEKVMKNLSEHCMVRHEAAEALGSIATDDANNVVQLYLKDKDDIVRESCEVALDISDYWNTEEDFQEVEQTAAH